jgi:hypothetical protein
MLPVIIRCFSLSRRQLAPTLAYGFDIEFRAIRHAEFSPFQFSLR